MQDPEEDLYAGLFDDDVVENVEVIGEEETEDDYDWLNSIPPPISNDISFEEWNAKGEGLFDSAEEDLEDKLAAKYPHLTFDTPAMKGGYIHDELDVTNEDGEVFRWRMNTDYNASRSSGNVPSGVPSDVEGREAQSRADYINFLEFANKSKFNKEGKYKNSDDVRTLGPDYMVKNDKGQDVEMQVTPGLTKKAAEIMRSNPQVNSMEEAIDIAVDTEFGQMNIAWQQDLQNKKAKENFDYQNEVKSLINEGFNPNISGDAEGTMSNDELNKTIQTLEKLGMPKEVVATARANAQNNQGFLDYLSSGGSASSMNFNAGDPSFTRPSSVAARGVVQDNQEIRNNIREWLDGSQEWGPNNKGKQVMTAYNDYINEKSEREENEKEIEDVKEKGVDQELVDKLQKNILNKEGNTLTKEEARLKAEEDAIALTVQDNRTKRAKEDGARILEAELPFYKSKGELKSLIAEKQAIDKMEAGEEKTLAYKKYNEKLQDFLNDDEISLLKEDGKFVRKDRQNQVDALNLKNQNKKNDLKDLLLEAPDKLDEKLLDVDRELLNIAKDLKRKGLSETMNESTYFQLFGALGQELVGAEGSAFEDFRKINKWVETGEMPSLLTPLPQSDQDSFLFESNASAKDNLPSRWNELLDYRSTLLLAQSLNADPTTYESTVGDGFLAGVGRFVEGIGEATPEAIGMNAPLTEDKQRELGFDIIEDVYGIKKTDSDVRNLATIEHDLWKSSGKSIPGLVRMGAEIYLTTVATGGAGLGPAALRAATFRGLLRSGMSKGVAKSVASYTSAVMTEYIGLQGSNAMERGLGFGPGIENPELFALTASAIRLKGAQASNKFNNAILKTYENGSAAQRNALEYFYQVPTTASTKSGALKYTGSVVDRTVKSISRTATAASGKVVGAGTGAFTISAADNVGAVLTGDKTVSQALNDVTDPAHLMELGGALLFLGLSRPDRYSKQTIERFRTEIDLLRGNNPQWNKLRRSLGMKTVSDGNKEYKEGEEAFSNRVDEALEAKKKEINESDKTENQKKQEISNLEFNANRLKLKIPLDILAKDLANPEIMGSFKELEQAAYAISIGGFNAKNLAVIEGASFTSDGTSGFKMLELYGLDKAQAQNVVDFSYSMRDIATRRFQGDLNNPNFQKYIDESIAESRLEGAKEKLKKDYEANRLDKADYETQLNEIDSKLNDVLKNKKDLIEKGKVERTSKELKEINEYKEAGFDIKEMNDAEMKKFMEENGGNFSPTGFGYQGVVNGKSIALVNTEATARENVGGTAVHEIWHHPFERRIGDEAIEARARVIAKDTRDIEGARKQAEQEAREYLDNFIGGLKEKGILSMVSAEMSKRPGFNDAVLEQIVSGKEVPLSELKEFLNEFVQLNENGAFNNLKSEAQRKSSEKQSTKDLTEKEYNDALNDPIKFVDFVLSGKYNSKNINEFLKREADALGVETETTGLQASEKIISKGSKDASEVNKKIETKIIDQGSGGVRVRDIKDSKFKKQITDELTKANNTMIEVRARRAANNPRIQALEPSKRVSEKEFQSAFNAEFVEALGQYKPVVDGKRIPFGAYMNQRLTQRFKQALDKAKQGQFEGPEVRLEQPTKEGERGFDAESKDLNPEEAMIAKESSKSETTKDTKTINPLEAPNVKPKAKEIEDAIDFTEADAVSMRTGGFKGVGETYGGKAASIAFDVPEAKIMDSKKNLTYAKKIKDGIPEPSEAGNIQKAFSNKSKVETFIKNLPETNVSDMETNIGLEKLDVSRDVYGYGTGMNNRVLNTFYNKTGKRSKGLTSQTGVWELKPEFKGKISNETIAKVQKELGITEAGQLNKYDRNIGQLLKGVAKLEGYQIANTVVRKKIEGMDIKSAIPKKQLLADLKAGANKFQASEKIKKSIEQSLKDPNLKLPDLIKRNKLNKDEAKFIGKALQLGVDSRKDLLQIIGEAKRNLLKNKEIVEELDRSPGELANIQKQYTSWKKAYPEIGKKFNLKDIEYVAKPESALFEGDLKERSLKNLQSAADIFPAVKDLNSSNAKYLAQALEAFLGIGNIKIDGKRLSREAIDELLEGKGKGEVKEWMTRVFQPNWNTVGLKKQWRQVLKEANEKFDPKSQEFKDFVANNGRDILTHPDLRGTENGFELTQEANREAIKYLLKGLKERFRKNPTKESLEDLARLLQLQTNHQKGILGGLVPMEYVTMVEAAGKKDPAKTLHNEHMKEKFNVSDDFLNILSNYKNELSNPKVDLAIDKLVSEMSQALTTYEGKEFKDSKEMGGPAKSNSANKMINTYLLKGSAETSLNLSGEGRGKTIADQFIEDYGLPILRKQLSKYDLKDLNVEGVKLKQKVDNAKELARVKKNNIEVAKEATMNASEKLTDNQIREELSKRDKALALARKVNKKPKKIRVFDFDDTVGTSKNKVFATKDGKKKVLNAEQFAKEGLDLIDKGWEMDFSDFNKVTEGGKGPLFDLMKTMKEAKGKRDIFILTARAPEAAPAIHEFLKQMGIDIPLENITGLGNSTGKAKADWLVGKAAEGYNDFYFADDAPQNVKAVRDALEVLDIKSQVQQARMNASEKLSQEFNKILEEKTGIGAEKVFSDIKAEIRGNKARKQRFFIPPSAEDFLGLLYATLPRGKKGEAALNFYQKNLFDPYTRATENLSTDRVNLMNDFKALKKELDVPADLRKETKSGFTNEQAVRVYMWGKEGKEAPGLSKTDLKELNDIVENNPKLKAFADQIFQITKGDGYSTPGKEWAVGTITTDLIEVLNKTKRAKYLEPWKENVDVIFSKENMNKLEAAYGRKYREAMENMLARMKSGSNRTAGGNRLSNQVLDYINNSTGVTMFFNTRSALLQTISAANFVNWSFNNPLMAGKAFANQPQYWKDFTKLMNSDYLKDRRNGLKLNINESEIADAAKTSKNKAKAALNYILEKGYTPTKFADSFAIASGGAMFYRNRINNLVKKGMSVKEAEAQAMKEFRQVSEKSQQSSDPSKISMQQSGDLGRIILQYANTPMQYARIQKRAIQDIANGRGDMKANLSKVIYYGFLQNLMFNALQQGAFALGFGDDFTDDDKDKKTIDTVNGMLDSSLRGLGLGGVTIQVLKNLGLDIYKRSGKKRPEYTDAYYKLLEFSPSIKSKLSRFKSAAYPFDSKKRRQEVFDKGFSLDNPAYESMAKVVTAVTNVPLDRMYSKINNLKDATADDIETWQAIANVLGWPTWQLKPKKSKKAEPELKYNNKSKSYEDKYDGLFD